MNRLDIIIQVKYSEKKFPVGWGGVGWGGPQPDLVSALSQTLALARVEVWLELDNFMKLG